jgi:hypothetical protein
MAFSTAPFKAKNIPNPLSEMSEPTVGFVVEGLMEWVAVFLPESL